MSLTLNTELSEQWLAKCEEIKNKLRTLTQSESELTWSVVRQVVTKLQIMDPQVLPDVVEIVAFYTGNPDHGWGSSDTSAVIIRAVEERLNAPKA